MDSKEWLQKEKCLYSKNYDQVLELFKLTGNTFLKITFTYIAIYNFQEPLLHLDIPFFVLGNAF